MEPQTFAPCATGYQDTTPYRELTLDCLGKSYACVKNPEEIVFGVS